MPGPLRLTSFTTMASDDAAAARSGVPARGCAAQLRRLRRVLRVACAREVRGMEAPAARFRHPLGVCDSQQRLCQALGELDARALGAVPSGGRWLSQGRSHCGRQCMVAADSAALCFEPGAACAGSIRSDCAALQSLVAGAWRGSAQLGAARVSIVPMGLGGLCSYWFVGSVAIVVIDS